MKFYKLYNLSFEFTTANLKLSNKDNYQLRDTSVNLIKGLYDNNVGHHAVTGDDGSIYKYTDGVGLESKNDGQSLDSIAIEESDLKGKSIYRYPKLTLPRAKVDYLKDKLNVSVVRDKDKADFKVVSESTISSQLQASYYGYHQINDLRNLLKSYIESDLLTPVCKEKLLNFYKHLLKEQENGTNILIKFSKSHSWDYQNSERECTNFIKTYSQIIQRKKEVNYNIFTIKNKDILEDILNSKNLILDSDLCTIANKDSVTIDEETFYNIKSMSASGDKENVSLALEMMANCNIQDSFDKIALLMFYHDYDYKNCKNWNTVNVKSLRKIFNAYINLSCDSWNGRTYGYQQVIRLLIRDNSFTEFAYKQVAKSVFDNCIVGVLGCNRDNSPFQIDISAIKLNPNFKISEEVEKLIEF